MIKEKNQRRDFGEQPLVVAEENAKGLGNGEDELAAGEGEQALLIQVLGERQGALLRARGAEVKPFA